MAARPISSATISFGLVSVPVQLYSSAESKASISFNWIHGDCGTRVKQQYYCPKDDEVLTRDQMVKGYEFSKNQYVLFNLEELKALEEKKTESIDITEFVPFEQVGRIYLDKLYYLGPNKGGERAYKLLSQAMQETGLSAVAKYAARGKMYLVMIRPHGDEGLVMEQLKYADELRSFDEVPIGDGKVKKEELKLAVQLIKQAASRKFEPEKYDDEVRQRMLALIEKKVEGEDITKIEEPEAAEGQIIDLMEALKKSLAGKGESEKKPARRAERATKSTKKKKAAGSKS